MYIRVCIVFLAHFFQSTAAQVIVLWVFAGWFWVFRWDFSVTYMCMYLYHLYSACMPWRYVHIYIYNIICTIFYGTYVQCMYCLYIHVWYVGHVCVCICLYWNFWIFTYIHMHTIHAHTDISFWCLHVHCIYVCICLPLRLIQAKLQANYNSYTYVLSGSRWHTNEPLEGRIGQGSIWWKNVCVSGGTYLQVRKFPKLKLRMTRNIHW